MAITCAELCRLTYNRKLAPSVSFQVINNTGEPDLARFDQRLQDAVTEYRYRSIEGVDCSLLVVLGGVRNALIDVDIMAYPQTMTQPPPMEVPASR